MHQIPMKRKERDGVGQRKPPLGKFVKPTHSGLAQPIKASPQAPRNLLLAGCLAHEYLQSGTLLGQKWEPARADPTSAAEWRNRKPSQSVKAESNGTEASADKYKRYVEVATLLQTGGAHLPGIVNPTQLAHFLQM